MNKYMTTDCGNCHNFTHCNNNNLICISKYKVKERECLQLEEVIKAQKDLINSLQEYNKSLLEQLNSNKIDEG